MKLLDTLLMITDIISSISTLVVIITIGMKIKKMVHHRKIRKFISNYHHPVNIVLPRFDTEISEEKAPVILVNEANSATDISLFLSKAAIDSHIVADDMNDGNLIAIGGPLANSVTAAYIRKYFPTLIQIKSQPFHRERNFSREGLYILQPGNIGYIVKDTSYILSPPLNEMAFFIKLTKDILKEKRTVHLIFAYQASSTSKAIDYFINYFQATYSHYKNKSYIFAIQFDSTLNKITPDCKQFDFSRCLPNHQPQSRLKKILDKIFH